MKKFLKWAVITVVIVGLVAFSAFYIWSQVTYGPSEQLQELVDLEGISQKDAVVFEPKDNAQNGVGIILYPGAKVENTAYAYYAKGLVDQGYTVIIPEMLFNFALFNASKASDYMNHYSTIDHWVIGGHSLGGVAAAMYAAKHEVDGLIFLGSYPSETSDLSGEVLPVLSIHAEFDGLTLLEDIEAGKPLLPPHTVYEEIKGGNHAQFGMYGEQPGDLPAKISGTEQQEQMVELTLKWLGKNGL